MTMSADSDDLAAVRARAGKRFRDCDVEFVYPVCLPVYELRLRVVELEASKLSTAARFVLMRVPRTFV